MFRTRISNVLIPQYEHLKLSGALALAWGNERFEKPLCDFNSFVKGVALHDRGYGTFDESIIGEMDGEEWLAISRRGFYEEYDDKLADAIVKMHLLRLAKGFASHHPQVPVLIGEMEEHLEQMRQSMGIELSLLEFIDRITNFCDSISFDFCHQNTKAVSVDIQPTFSSTATVPLTYEISEDGKIEVSPWPFQPPKISGYLIGYEARGFPEKEPVLLPFTVEPLN